MRLGPTGRGRLLALLIAGCLGCAGQSEQTRRDPDAASGGERATGASCPPRAEAPERMPGTAPEHRTLEYWLGRYDAPALDAPLMTPKQIAAYNARVGRRPGEHPFAQRRLWPIPDRTRLMRELSERLTYMRERVESGQYVLASGEPVPQADRDALSSTLEAAGPELRVALVEVPIRCAPLPHPLYKPDLDTAYDRNACSTLRPQEAVAVIAAWSGGMRLVQTRYALGWIDADAALSPPVQEAGLEPVLHGPRVRAREALELKTEGGTAVRIPQHATLPRIADGRVLVATRDGIEAAAAAVGPAAALVPTRRPLTRRALLSTAFEFLGSPYGFGGKDGGRDCSRLQLDLFESFDIALPRHSGWQAKAGSFRVDVSGKPEADKLTLLRQAHARGAVLLQFPGHIMLYLGETEEGVPMALHALGEYARPCDGIDSETVVDVQRVVVSDLSLGRGSSRTSFIERLTTLVVLGGEPGDALAPVADTSPPPAPNAPPPGEECSDTVAARIFRSPHRPAEGGFLRLIGTASGAPADSTLWVFDPDGERLDLPQHRLGGPPHSVWARVDEARAGTYTALWMAGGERIACKRIHVRNHPPEPTDSQSGPVWEPRFKWERDTENLWAAFVEQLFDYPPDDGRTWTSLHALLRDPDRNLLHDHLSRGEDEAIETVPDCADLPYALRAYFAWKLNLPFAFRRCTRGRPGQPPTCGPLETNLMERAYPDDVTAFAHFVNRKVAWGVHSASGRTAPDDDETDLYPVALERRSLPPGTVYADPYGHVMILTQWLPQGRPGGDYGLLMAAEAQPDGTVGRRRFFRGSFLFDPSTKDVGAGFKHFRPLQHDAQAGAIVPLDNAALKKHREFADYSRQQYEITRDAFYDRMDALINPDPLDPHARLVSLVDAFEESVRRRVTAVDNGERFMAERSYQPIDMPVGHDIFETQGPWEDFSTPSRDMRLLISLDTVTGFPELVARQPKRFKLADAQAGEETKQALQAALERELRSRTITYTRSDGKPQELNLWQLRRRADALEMAYNPNDCVELRWAAPEGSKERDSCKRHAPAEQRARMKRYRPWFRERTRPPRGARAP